MKDRAVFRDPPAGPVLCAQCPYRDARVAEAGTLRADAVELFSRIRRAIDAADAARLPRTALALTRALQVMLEETTGATGSERG
jgi:hypothetical protein